VWLAWSVDRPRRQQSAVAALQQFNPDIVIERAHEWEDRAPTGNLLVRWFFGDDACEDIVSVRASYAKLDDETVTWLAQFSELQRLSLDHNDFVGDVSVYHLSNLRKLEYLGLAVTQLTDAGLQHLKKLRSLKAIDLGHTGITDAGTKALGKLELLENITLRDCQVGDATAKTLAPLSNLKDVDFSHTPITDEGLRALAFAKSLRRLNVRHCSRITEVGVRKLREDSPLLQVTADFATRNL
jgi:hypothetical protein